MAKYCYCGLKVSMAGIYITTRASLMPSSVWAGLCFCHLEIWTSFESGVQHHNHSKSIICRLLICLPYFQMMEDMQWNVSSAQHYVAELSAACIHPGMAQCQCNILHSA